MSDQIGLRRDVLADSEINGVLMQQRAAKFGQWIEDALLQSAVTRDRDDSATARGSIGMAGDAGNIIEDWSESAIGGFHIFKFGHARTEVRRLFRRESSQRCAQLRWCWHEIGRHGSGARANGLALVGGRLGAGRNCGRGGGKECDEAELED